MAKIVDARGLPCPQPVIMTRNALQESDAVTTIVDNETSQHNVTRMAEKSGCTVRAEELDDGIYLHMAREATPLENTVPQPVGPAGEGPLVLTIPDESMGRGEPELGQILVRGFFHTLGEIEPLPTTIIFFNSGVKLVVEGSPVLEDLLSLRDKGIEILVCGTCLDYFGLKDTIAVGEVSNMYTIAETMLGAGRVTSL